jgi:hypothetical protein
MCKLCYKMFMIVRRSNNKSVWAPVLLAASALALAGCGGEGSGGSGSPPIVLPPAPTPTPTPTPPPPPTLTTLTATTPLAFVEARGDFNPTSGIPPELGVVTGARAEPSPSRFLFDLGAPSLATLAIGPTTRDAAASDATFDAHRGSAGGLTYSGRQLVIGSGNPALALTYSSFADLLTTNGSAQSRRYQIAFGLPSTAAQIPASGTVRYTGVIYGYGRSWNQPGPAQANIGFYTLTGTAIFDLSAASATSRRFDGTLTIVPAVTSGRTSNTTLTTLNIRFADVANPGFDGTTEDTFPGIQHQGRGLARGQFFGPNADEFAASFTLNAFSPGGPSTITDYGGIVLLRRAN